MQRDTIFPNKLIKRKDYQRSMFSHLQSIKNAKPLTRPLDGFDICINKMKKQYQNQMRFTQIQRQNRILLQKINGIMRKSSRRGELGDRGSRSLNATFRRKQNQQIQQQNAKLLKRLQQKKPNYTTQLFEKSYTKQKTIQKLMSNLPFMLSANPQKQKNSIPSSSRSQINHTQYPYFYGTSMDKYKDKKQDNIELVRVRIINGISFFITVLLNARMMRIVGDSQQIGEPKVIQIQRMEAIGFLEEECHGKLDKVFNHLRYDKENEVLYLVGNDVELDEILANENPDNQNLQDTEHQKQIETPNPQNTTLGTKQPKKFPVQK